MKIAIITAVHQRLLITELFYQRLFKTINSGIPFDFEVFVAGDDLSHKALCNEFEYNWVDIDNTYLGLKFNKALEAARTCNPDYVMTLGSDDLILPELFTYYEEYMNKSTEFFGIDTMHFYNGSTNEMKLFIKEYESPLTLGAGRMYSKDLLDKFNWYIWPYKVNRGLDRQASWRIRSSWIKETVVDIPQPFICDVKTDVNINKFKNIPGTLIDPSAIEKYLEDLYLDKNYFEILSPIIMTEYEI